MGRRPGRRGPFCGYASVCVGALIFIMLLMPSWFWWTLCAGLLIFGGVWLLRM